MASLSCDMWLQRINSRNVFLWGFALKHLINVLVFIYNSPSLTEDSDQEPLPLESDFLTTVSYTFYIYSYNFSLLRNYSQSNKNTTFLLKILSQITATFLQFTAKNYYKPHQKFVTIENCSKYCNLQHYYKLRHHKRYLCKETILVILLSLLNV